MNAMTYVKKHWLWIIVNVAALVPLGKLLWDFAGGRLIDPIGEMTNVTGFVALVLLVASLAVTPLLSLTGYRKAATVRKSLGLQGFFYVTLHLLIFIGLDYGMNLNLILGDAILSKRFVLIGFAAFLLLTPLAITSTTWWMKRLGKNWKRLHRVVYLAVPLGALHYYLVEKIPTEPLIWATVIALLLIARLSFVRRRLSSVRQFIDGLTKRSAKPAHA